MKRYIASMIAILALAIPVFSYASTWQMDPDHSSFQFKIRHLTVSNVKGDFSKAKGIVTIDEKDITQLKVDVEGPTPEVKDPWGSFRRGATATTKINRRDFGMTWNKILDTGGLLVGEDVDIYVEVELVKK